MAFETFDLGRVLQTAEGIKAQRRQPAEDALRNRVLTAQAAGAEQNTMLQKQQADQQMEVTTAHRAYYTARAVLSAADPKAAAESLAPDFVKHFDETHGAGAWKGLTPEQAVQAAKAIQTQALGIIGPQQKVKWVDSGGQQIAVDEETGVPIKEVAPIAKTATPDATLQAQTSSANAELQARTSRANAQLQASTSAATQGPSKQLVTRPTADGKVQDFAFNPKTTQMEPVGEPYKPSASPNLRPIPGAVAQGIIANRSSIGQIDRALTAIDKNPDALGLHNAYIPDMAMQRLPGKAYSEGGDVRAKVADIGSLKIHDRSGAAVTVNETPRLKPFIPLVTDTPAQAKVKLEQLKLNMQAMQEETEAFYTPESGYRPISPDPATSAPSRPQPASAAPADKGQPSSKVIDFNSLPH